MLVLVVVVMVMMLLLLLSGSGVGWRRSGRLGVGVGRHESRAQHWSWDAVTSRGV